MGARKGLTGQPSCGSLACGLNRSGGEGGEAGKEPTLASNGAVASGRTPQLRARGNRRAAIQKLAVSDNPSPFDAWNANERPLSIGVANGKRQSVPRGPRKEESKNNSLNEAAILQKTQAKFQRAWNEPTISLKTKKRSSEKPPSC